MGLDVAQLERYLSTTEQPTSVADLDAELEAGTQVGEYVVAERIGVGGFGTVYRAEHPLIGKAVAIKVLGLKLSADPEMVSRFVAEARSVNQIQSKYIIDIFGFGQLADGRQYYIMELLDGMPLDEYLDTSGCLSVGEAFPILRGIAKALDAAHGSGVAHRDLKPENVYLVADEQGGFRPKLLDFGIAKLLSDRGSMHKTRTGAPMGTPLYMSPEQCRGKGVDHRTDIYAFGCVVFHMLTGRVPFDGDGYMDILFQQIQSAPPAPSSVNAALPETIDAPVMAMMAKDPAERPPTLAASIKILESAAWAAGLTIPPGSISAMNTPVSSGFSAPVRSSGERAAIAGANTITSVEPLAKSNRRLWLALASVVGIGALGAFVAAYLLTRNGEQAAAIDPAPVDSAVAVSTPVFIDAASVVTPSKALTFVTIEVRGVPSGTEVFWGPRGMIGNAPGKLQLPSGEQILSLQLRAQGYFSKSVEVVPSNDHVLNVELAAKPTAKKARGKGGRAKVKRGKSDRSSGNKGSGDKGSGGKNSIEDPFGKN